MIDEVGPGIPMRRAGQHYLNGTPTAAAAVATGGDVEAVVSCDNHGDNTVFFTWSQTAGESADVAYRHRYHTAQRPAVFDAMAFAGRVLVAAARDGSICALSGDADVKSVSQASIAEGRATAVHGLSDFTAALVFEEGDIGVLDVESLALSNRVDRVAAYGGLTPSSSCVVDQNTMIIGCRHTLALVDVRAPSDAARCWRGHQAETFSAVTAMGPTIAAGTSEGTVALFDMRGPVPIAHAVGDAGSAIVGMVSVQSDTFVTQASSGALRLWRTDQGLPSTGDLFHPDPSEVHAGLGAPGGGVALAVAAGAGVVLATDDSGMIDVFAF